MVDTLSIEYISVKAKVFLQKIKIFFPSFFISCVIICLTALGLLLSFDFFLNTGISILKFFECVAIYFVIMELVPYIKKLVIFK